MPCTTGIGRRESRCPANSRGCTLSTLGAATLQLTAEEKAHLERFFTWDGESRRLEFLNSRRKNKKTYEYEVKWFGQRDSRNSWITREACVSASLPHASPCSPGVESQSTCDVCSANSACLHPGFAGLQILSFRV